MNFNTDLTIQGNLVFKKDIVGVLPPPAISTAEGNTLTQKEDGLYTSGGTSLPTISTVPFNSLVDDSGLYTAFGYEHIRTEDMFDLGELTVIESLSRVELLKSTQITSVSIYKWLITESNVNASVTIIPTTNGKYIYLSQIPFDPNGNQYGSRFMYIESDSQQQAGAESILYTTTEPNDQLQRITTKTNYDTLTQTGKYLVVGVTNKWEVNAPYSSSSEVMLFVTNSLINGSTYLTQLAIGTDQYSNGVANSLKMRTGKINDMPFNWETINTTEYLSTVFVQAQGKNDLDVSLGYGGSQVYGYQVQGMQKPQSLPTQRDGTAMWFQSGYKSSVIGSYSGFTLASDVDGRLFLNVEMNDTTDEKSWNWKELLTLSSPALISTAPGNIITASSDGLFVPAAPVSEVVISQDNQNQLTNLVVGDNPGLFVRPVSIQLLPDDSIYRSPNNSNPKNTDIRVNISTEPYNLLRLSPTTNKGLYAPANHAVIPKFTTAQSGILFTAATTYPNGSMKLTTNLSMNNPTGVTRYNNVSLYSVASAIMKEYFLDAEGNPIQTQTSAQILTITSSTITVSITSFIYGTPALAFKVDDNTPFPVGGGVPNMCNVIVSLLVGTTITNAFA